MDKLYSGLQSDLKALKELQKSVQDIQASLKDAAKPLAGSVSNKARLCLTECRPVRFGTGLAFWAVQVSSGLKRMQLVGAVAAGLQEQHLDHGYRENTERQEAAPANRRRLEEGVIVVNPDQTIAWATTPP